MPRHRPAIRVKVERADRCQSRDQGERHTRDREALGQTQMPTRALGVGKAADVPWWRAHERHSSGPSGTCSVSLIPRGPIASPRWMERSASRGAALLARCAPPKDPTRYRPP